MIRSRRGISPLIATVLLLAFAVAVGTMAVSYLVDATKSEPCDNVNLAVLENAPVCYKDGRVSLIVTNRGEDTIYSAMLTFINAKGELAERRVALALGPAESTKVDVDYQALSLTGVQFTIVPAIVQDGRDSFCYEKEIRPTLQACG